ncbi:MAG: primosomal protein N', partial [Variovorax sp.]|nr:primosomal protein N' [Variovorax sp.]
MSTEAFRIDVAVQTPAHSQVGDVLSYVSPVALAPGTLVRVPLGRREVLGVAWACAPAVAGADEDGVVLKLVAAALDALAPLPEAWRDLVAFAARYYQRSLGEVALAALPPQLRGLNV